MQIAMLASGSSGNSILVRAADTTLLIDIGVSCRYVCNSLHSINVDPASVDAVLITHEHTDHVSGVATFAKKTHARIYANTGTWLAGKKHLDTVDENKREVFRTHEPFSVGEVIITPFAVSHDAAEPVGYQIETEEQKLVIATDLGVITQGVFQHLKDADALVIEANHDREMLRQGPYPHFLKKRVASNKGHLPNDVTAEVLKRILTTRTKIAVLAHLSATNNTPDIAIDTVRSALDEDVMDTVEILVAGRKEVSPLMTVHD